jgi:hypothetical protein
MSLTADVPTGQFPPALPRPLWEHILERVAERAITGEDLQTLRSWVVTEPWARNGDWYKDFGSFIICGTRAIWRPGAHQRNLGRFRPKKRHSTLDCAETFEARNDLAAKRPEFSDVTGPSRHLVQSRQVKNAGCKPFAAELRRWLLRFLTLQHVLAHHACFLLFNSPQ